MLQSGSNKIEILGYKKWDIQNNWKFNFTLVKILENSEYDDYKQAKYACYLLFLEEIDLYHPDSNLESKVL